MREPTFIAAVGAPGNGKTRENIQMIKKVLMGVPEKNVMPQKVLVVDANDELGDKNKDVIEAGIRIKSIHVSQISSFSASKYIEACRIRPFNDKGQAMSLNEIADVLNEVMYKYKNGLLIAEDFKSYAGDAMKQDLVSRLCTRRHSGTDTVVSLQGIGMILPKMWSNLKWLRLHKINESMSRHQNKFPEKIDYLSIAENIVNKKYTQGGLNEYFFVMIDLMRGFIYGKYTQEEFNIAASEYIGENWSNTAGKYMNKRNLKGKKIYTEETAMKACLNNFAWHYSQFSTRLLPKK